LGPQFRSELAGNLGTKVGVDGGPQIAFEIGVHAGEGVGHWQVLRTQQLSTFALLRSRPYTGPSYFPDTVLSIEAPLRILLLLQTLLENVLPVKLDDMLLTQPLGFK